MSQILIFTVLFSIKISQTSENGSIFGLINYKSLLKQINIFTSVKVRGKYYFKILIYSYLYYKSRRYILMVSVEISFDISFWFVFRLSRILFPNESK